MTSGRLCNPVDLVDDVNIMPHKVDKVNRKVEAAGDPREAGADIGEKLHALVHRMRRHLQHTVRDRPDAGTPMEWRALGFFARQPGACARDLVEHSGRDKAQVARLVRGLVDRGFLEAATPTQDQRVQPLRLSAAGRQEARRMQLQRERIDQRMLASLDERERRMLSDLLDRMHAALGEP
jgi:DNA-binding MarR family transcriptional regulator